MKIYLGGDHAGYDLKETLKLFLFAEGHKIDDVGPHTRELADDYPDFVKPVAQKVAADPGSMGIVIGGSGEGEAIVANRIRGVRAVVVYSANEKIVRLSREHNNANVLSLGARFLTDDEAKAIVHLWLSTPFLAESRHARRIAKIDQ